MHTWREEMHVPQI